MVSKKDVSATIKYQEIQRELQENMVRSVYLFTGEEDYLIENLCQSIIKKVITPGAEGFDYQKITGQALTNWSPSALLAATKQLPFMSTKRVFHFINCQWFQGGASKNTELLDFLQNVGDEAVIIFTEGKVDKKQKKILDLLQKKGIFAQFDYLATSEIVHWIGQYANKLSLKIKPEAAVSLAERCQNSMRLIAQEFKKFSLYAAAREQREIDMAFLNLMSIPDTSGDIFKLTEFLLSKNHQAAFELLNRLLEQNQSVLLLIFLIGKHLKQLLFAKYVSGPEELATELKMMPFIAKKLFEQSKRFTTDELTTYYEECYQADLAIKSGRMSDNLALDFLLSKIH